MIGSTSRMQGKEASEQETKAKSSVGIDVSKCWLDIHVLPSNERLRVTNDCAGIRQLKRWLARFDIALAAIEATGKWHRHVQRSLVASGIPTAAVDPFRVRMFAKAQGILAKTDRLDARVLALFAAVMDPSVRAPAPQIMAELAELVVARAVEAQVALKNQVCTADGKFLKRQLERRLGRASKDIAELESEILKRIKTDNSLAKRYTILTSIPSFGFAVAATLLACLAEIGSTTAKQIAMLAGLAPIADQSGERDGLRVIWGGRPIVRRILYLAALSATRFNADMKSFYKRLREHGKPPKVALIAVARKLVVLANTLITEDRNWQPRSPKHA
jgi:transposase